MPPIKLSIICDRLDGLPASALEFLVLKINTLQADVEYQFLPADLNDTYFKTIKKGVSLNEFNEHTRGFVKSYKKGTGSITDTYHLKDGAMGRLVFVFLCTISEQYYEVYEPGYSAIFLGDWKDTMAPPSLLEFIISLLIMEGIYAMMPENAPEISHLGTRGCIGDFNPSLEDVRYKVLHGFICDDCSQVIIKAVGPDKLNTWRSILKKEWLGSPNDFMSPANIVTKLGYNLFITKGLSPTFWEKTKQTLTEDGVKEAIKLVAMIVGAALLFWLGFHKS